MIKDKKFDRRIVKPVVKEIKRYKKKNLTLPQKEELEKLKIQTATAFDRTLLSIVGLCVMLMAGVVLFFQSPIFGMALLTSGSALLVIGIRGKKRELRVVLKTYGIINDTASVLSVIADIAKFM